MPDFISISLILPIVIDFSSPNTKWFHKKTFGLYDEATKESHREELERAFSTVREKKKTFAEMCFITKRLH